MTEFPSRLMDGVLPPNATSFERVLASQVDRMLDLDVERIRHLWDPWKCHEDELAYLAWAMSVDLWDPQWDLLKKRSVVATELERHRHKGTLWGISSYIDVAGGKLRKAITPPGHTLLMPALTDAEREAYLARFAQLRVYPYVAAGSYPYAAFTNKGFGREKAFVGSIHPWNTFPWQRFKRTAKLWDAGQETDLSLTTIEPERVSASDVALFDRVTLPSKRSGQTFLNDKPARNFLGDDKFVGERMISVRRDVPMEVFLPRERRTTQDMSLEFVNVRPEYVAEKHDGQPGALYAGRFLDGHHLPPSIAWRHIYERWHIHDPERVPEERKRSTHLGFTRLGMPAYHAELQVEVRSKLQPLEAQRFVSGFLRVREPKPLEQVRHAVDVSRSLRDKVLIATKTHRPLSANDRARVGSATVGSLIEI